jgi:hypothetical protein
VNKGMVNGAVRSIVSGYTLGDPVTVAGSLKELCEVDIKDSLAWVSAMKQMVDTEEDPEALRQAIVKIRTLNRKEVIERELATNLVQHMATRLTINTLLKEDVPVTRLLERADQIAASI